MTDTTTHITTSGGLISAAFIENIRELDTRQRGTEPETFAMPGRPPTPSRSALEDEIAAAWELVLERWDAIHSRVRMMDVSQVRQRWLLPLFAVLDFDPVYLRGDVVLDEAEKLRYPLSHRGWEGDHAPVLHTVIPSQKLDERQDGGRGIKAKSPHDMLQAFLNASRGPVDGWGLLSNGVLLRVLREYHHTFTKGYVQFDLEAIFETRNYADFRALYRMCHASRFIPQGEGVTGTSEVPVTLCPLEQFYKDSLAAGVKVGEDLRGQVRQAIETLGNGFLATSPDLIRRLQDDDALCRRYYGEILRVIYRVLFLLFAEQRGMMPGRDSLYAQEYSIAALRDRAEDHLAHGATRGARFGHTDLWEGLKVTFRMVRDGVPELGVFGYDGMLFSENQTPLLDGRTVRNDDLLRAIRALTLIEREGVLQRISYADLGVEELGSIYESLLDFTPRVTREREAIDDRQIPPHTFFLDPRGSERKTTGSYYTHDSLVNELIKSALLPVARERLAEAGLPVNPEGDLTGLVDLSGLDEEQRAAGEEALLSLKICDPAAGSGHFLVKANDALGAELARVRSGDEYPTEAQIQAAKRDVLARCIYAVDLNPMAVELCKVSLWINASVRDRPLSFLDHHIQCGNSLIGTTPDLMAEGVPYEAFDHTLVGNHRERAKEIRKRNRQERRDFEKGGGYQPSLFRVTVFEPEGEVWQHYQYVTTMAEERPQAARERYAAYLSADETQRRKLEADFWTAAFFWEIDEDTTWAPTYGEFVRLRSDGPETIPPEALEKIEALTERYKFLHWHLAFPEVFTDEGEGGFDVVLGNPPWERIKLQEKEFFADKDAEIANARTASARGKLIKKLPQTDPELHAAYTDALRKSEATSHFLRESGRYPLSAVGDIDTYQVFAGLVRHLIASRGRAGIIVPSGIATDYFSQDYFNTVVEKRELVTLFDFENRKKIFPDMEGNRRFSLLTLAGEKSRKIALACQLQSVGDLFEENRTYSLEPEDVEHVNPNTSTLPMFRTRKDAQQVVSIHNRVPILVAENRPEGDPWDVSFLRMFDMTNDSHLFHTSRDMEDRIVYEPLYEAKLCGQYNHRHATFEGISFENMFKTHAGTNEPDNEQLRDPAWLPLPRYWISKNEIRKAVREIWEYDWFIGFRNAISAVADSRSVIFLVLPRCGVGNSMPLLFTSHPPVHNCALVANFNTFVLDYVTRQKASGSNLNFYIVKQLPVLPPDRYTPDLLDVIVPRVVELTYTAWDLQPFAQDVLDEVGEETWARWFADAPVHDSPPPSWAAGETPAPFVWDEDRRAMLRAELDAVYAHLYGLTRDELAYILDTFPIVKRKDEAEYGEYRTKRMILERYEEVGPLTR